MIRLTERDKRLVSWIADLYGVQLADVAGWMGTSTHTARKRLDGLTRWDMLARAVVVHRGGPWWSVTPAGLAWAGCDFSTWEPGPATVGHLRAVLDVRAWLLGQYLAASWVGERSIKRDRARAADLRGKGGRSAGHVPDGELAFPGADPVAIEVDLSPKALDRRRAIVERLILDGYNRAWYFVPASMLDHSRPGTGMLALRDSLAGAIRRGFELRLFHLDTWQEVAND